MGKNQVKEELVTGITKGGGHLFVKGGRNLSLDFHSIAGQSTGSKD